MTIDIPSYGYVNISFSMLGSPILQPNNNWRDNIVGEVSTYLNSRSIDPFETATVTITFQIPKGTIFKTGQVIKPIPHISHEEVTSKERRIELQL